MVSPVLLVFRWHGLFSSGTSKSFDEQTCERLRTTKADENISRVTAVLNKHQSAG